LFATASFAFPASGSTAFMDRLGRFAHILDVLFQLPKPRLRRTGGELSKSAPTSEAVSAMPSPSACPHAYAKSQATLCQSGPDIGSHSSITGARGRGQEK